MINRPERNLAICCAAQVVMTVVACIRGLAPLVVFGVATILVGLISLTVFR